MVGDRDAGPTCHARVQMIRYDVTTRVCHVSDVTLRLLEPTSSLTQLPLLPQLRLLQFYDISTKLFVYLR